MSFLTTLVGSKVAVSAITLGGLALGGTTAAAYTGTLPQPLQHAAHQYVGAPLRADDDQGEDATMPTPSISDIASPDVSASTPLVEVSEGTVSASPTSTPVGPDATGPAAYGLCTAYTHDGLKAGSVAYAALVSAAQTKGATDVAAYCTGVIAAKHAAHPLKTTSTEVPSLEPSTEPSEDAPKSSHSHPKASLHHSSAVKVEDDATETDSEDSSEIESDDNSATETHNGSDSQTESGDDSSE